MIISTNLLCKVKREVHGDVSCCPKPRLITGCLVDDPNRLQKGSIADSTHQALTLLSILFLLYWMAEAVGRLVCSQGFALVAKWHFLQHNFVGTWLHFLSPQRTRHCVATFCNCHVVLTQVQLLSSGSSKQ